MDEKQLQAELLQEFQTYEIEDDEKPEDENDDILSEESRDSQSHPFAAYILITFLWIHGFRSNSNLIYVPNEQQIYCGNGENKKLDAIRFRCYSNNCPAKVYLKKDGSAIVDNSNVRRHDHGSVHTTFRRMECINLMKRLCTSSPASTMSRKIYDQAVLE